MCVQSEGGYIWVQSEGQVVYFWVYFVCGLLVWLGLLLLFVVWWMFRILCYCYELIDQCLFEQCGVFLCDIEQFEFFWVCDIFVVEFIVQCLFGCGCVVLLMMDCIMLVIVLNVVFELYVVVDFICVSVQVCWLVNGVCEVQE